MRTAIAAIVERKKNCSKKVVVEECSCLPVFCGIIDIPYIFFFFFFLKTWLY